ncbi:exodeoxyribonuclease VII small subunit [Ignatzschineria ureiclastica]|uniref:Exodeoxyribonuclease 7 small subunit n=1 Tax=Ignatzschineria ureiclastica TaxID=472582 RepID=A0A2U2AEP6_9GAMM|nr:exodeoxyribonuclease VII small subunit [Ignatzschineria ureiclastica]
MRSILLNNFKDCSVSEKNVENQSIESLLQKLNEIVESLESDELPLEESLKQFEQGIALTKACQETLEASEKRINQLLSHD